MTNGAYPFIDTNIFIRFLTTDPINPHLYQSAARIFQKIHDGTITVQTTILIVAEIVYVLEKIYRFTPLEIATKLAELLAYEYIFIEDKEIAIKALHVYRDRNIDFEDAHTYAVMRNAGVNEIYTFDHTDFEKLPEVTIVPKNS